MSKNEWILLALWMLEDWGEFGSFDWEAWHIGTSKTLTQIGIAHTFEELRAVFDFCEATDGKFTNEDDPQALRTAAALDAYDKMKL